MESDLDKKSLFWSFLIGLSLTFLLPVMAPQWHLTYFAPFLIIAMYQKSLTTCLILAICCGTIIDGLSSYATFGIHATAYTGAMAILFSQRRNVFADSLTTLPFMVLVFSALSCAFLATLLDLLDITNVFSWPWIITDLMILPAVDGAVAFALYILPALLFGKRRRAGNEYFLSR
jgi:hypothetical protein